MLPCQAYHLWTSSGDRLMRPIRASCEGLGIVMHYGKASSNETSGLLNLTRMSPVLPSRFFSMSK